MPDVQAADSSSATFVPSDSQRTVDAIPPSERENWRLKGTPFPQPTETTSEGESADTPAAEPVEQVVSTETQAPPASEPGTGAKPKGAKARSHELDADIQELHAKLAERAALRRQLAEEERQPAPAQAKPQAQPQPAAPFPDFASWLTQHPTAAYEDYIDARAEDRVERKWAEQEARVQAERQATQRREAVSTRQSAHLERIKAAQEADPQFLEKLRPEFNSPRYTPLDLLPVGTTPTWSNVISQRIFEAPQSVELMKLLSKDEGEWQALNSLTDYSDIVERIGILKSKLSTNGKASRQLSGAPPVSAVQIGRSQSEPADEAKAALKTGDFRRYREIMNARDIAKAK